MIGVLFDGAAHTAGELAAAAGVTSGTASQHLKVLVAAELVTVRADGRHHRYELANARIAHALEQLAGPKLAPVTSLRLSREQVRVRAARTCYDHLAGQLGVNIAQRFVDAGWVDPAYESLTPSGRRALHTYFEVCPGELAQPGSRRPLLRRCVDWTERRDHLAGRVGAKIAQQALENAWVVRKPASRAVTITPAGREALARVGVAIPSA